MITPKTTSMRNPVGFTFIMFILCVALQVVHGCLPKEREALLQFKAAIVDSYNMLSSWSTPDCCQWQGIRCSNLTAHILRLHLPGDFHLEYEKKSRRYVSGEIYNSLTELEQLEYLNLSSNFFPDTHIPHFLGSLTNLRYLDLFSCHFRGEISSQLGSLSHLKYLNLAWNFLEGSIPRQLGNLSQLQHLDLSGNFLEGNIPSQLGNLSQLQEFYLGGYDGNLKIDNGGEWLSNLISLTHLSLESVSNHNGSHSWLQVIARLPKLRELSLVHCSLSDHFILSSWPYHFNFSTSLSLLDLSKNTFTSPMIFKWVSNFTPNLVELDLSKNLLEGFTSSNFGMVMNSLWHLDLSSNYLKARDLKSFVNICTLQSLIMHANNFTEDLPSILSNLSSGCVRHSLQELDLSGNDIIGNFPELSVFSSLKRLVLDENHLSGEIPQDIILPPQLESLSIRRNSFEGGIPKSFGNACALRSLDMSYNNLSEEFSVIIHHLSGCARYSLEVLEIGMNQIKGTLLDFSTFTSLKILYLSENKLNGEIPKYIQFPSHLEELYMHSNSLKGVLTDSHFANMFKLRVLDLSENSLAMAFTQNWVPPFQLFKIQLSSCNLGPTFPKWLLTQNEFSYIDISNASISDIVPELFWAKLPLLQKIVNMDISFNNFRGIIPNFPQKNLFIKMSLASNHFEGPIPVFLRNSIILDLSKNNFSDSHLFLCSNGTVENLIQLDLSNNQLSGQISDCWSHFKSLSYLDLSYNNFSGKISASLGSLRNLEALLMRNNNLIEGIPFSLTNCKYLIMLDISENKLSGSIPDWIGTIEGLQVLSLRRNQFFGILPLKICYLRSIHMLDLSLNNLSGKIPQCIQNLTSMAETASLTYFKYNILYDVSFSVGLNKLNVFLTWKGSERMFQTQGLSLVRSIDLSSNHFSEEIPIEIEKLSSLVSLNLSRNNLIGKIPSNIGKLASLDSLDLSRNQLDGSIPSSLTQIHGLGVLDLSHNHLSGNIPIGTQLQSFNISSYEDNLDLCGPPLENLCDDGKPTQEASVEVQDEYSFFNNDFFVSMTFGFVLSFWMIFGSILFNRSWRHAYFNFLNNLEHNVHLKITVFAKVFKVDKE